jgi:nicotinamidase-related amidase
VTTGLVITDPQNDFLSPEGVTWELVGDSVTRNRTIEHLEELLRAAKDADVPVFVSPHYYYPYEHRIRHRRGKPPRDGRRLRRRDDELQVHLQRRAHHGRCREAARRLMTSRRSRLTATTCALPPSTRAIIDGNPPVL